MGHDCGIQERWEGGQRLRGTETLKLPQSSLGTISVHVGGCMCVSVETALGVDWSGYIAHEATCPPGISVSCAAMSTSKAVQIRAESRPCFCVLVKMFACPHVGVSLCVFIHLCILEASGPHVHGSDVLIFSPSPHLSASSFSAFRPQSPPLWPRLPGSPL